jgi:hypothetical protein
LSSKLGVTATWPSAEGRRRATGPKGGGGWLGCLGQYASRAARSCWAGWKLGRGGRKEKEKEKEKEKGDWTDWAKLIFGQKGFWDC